MIRDFGLARLGFGDGSAPRMQPHDRPVTTIRMPGLSLPEPSAARDTYTRAERVSVATLSLVAAYALRLISGDRSRHKVVGLDEIWFLLASPQGRQVINRLVRLGRAFNATLLLGTHRIGDLGDLSDLIGVVFVFGQDSEDAARAALRFIGLDADPRAGRSGPRIPGRAVPDARPARPRRRGADRPRLPPPPRKHSRPPPDSSSQRRRHR